MWKWMAKWLRDLIDEEPAQHTFESAISIREGDGRLAALRCTQCGYCVYEEDRAIEHPPCVPRAHAWVPVKVFQWEHLALANKLPEPLQCALCGAHASTHNDWEKFGCPGSRLPDDPRPGV
jgi:hypothetical protein